MTVLLAAAAAKAADRTGTMVALTAYGVPGRLAAPAFAVLVAVEAALAAALAAGIDGAPYAAGLVLACFLVAQVVALGQGNEGAPCGCFGAGGRLSRAAAGRTALLACACAALPLLGPGPGLPLVLTAAIAAAVVVLSAGRRSAPRGALELEGEGPPLNEPSPLAAWFEDAPEGDVRLAVFTSPGCSLCKRIAPAADALARDALVLRRFDEVERHRGVGGRTRPRRALRDRARTPTASCWPRERSTTGASSRRSSTRRARGGARPKGRPGVRSSAARAVSRRPRRVPGWSAR